MSDRSRNARDPEKNYGDSTEFSWGPGPVQPGKENALIREGGIYRAKCPPVEPGPSPDLSVRARQARWSRGDPPRGYPGERVG